MKTSWSESQVEAMNKPMTSVRFRALRLLRSSASDSDNLVFATGVVNGIGGNGNVLDSADSDSVDLYMTPLTTPIFDFHKLSHKFFLRILIVLYLFSDL